MKKPKGASSFSNIFNNFFQFLIFSNKYNCGVWPSCEPRLISSSSVGVFIRWQMFLKISDIVNRRFSVIPLWKNCLTFRVFNFESQHFFRLNNFLRSFETVLELSLEVPSFRYREFVSDSKLSITS